MLGKDAAHALHARLNLAFIIGGAVLPQQVLKHVARHRCIALHELDEVLTDYVARKYIVQFLVQCVHAQPYFHVLKPVTLAKACGNLL